MTQAVAVNTQIPMRRVALAELPSVWPDIERGLQACLTKYGPQDWEPKDVHDRIVDGSAALYVRAEGFIVLEQCTHQISRKRYLNAWVAWFRPGEAKKRMHTLISWLDAITAANNCEWWELISPHDGWKGLEPFCKRVSSVWRRV